MNHSKLYVPNPQKWVHFFDKVAKVKQRGGGKVPQILPLDKYTAIESQNNQIPVKAVTPAEQTVQQAKSELERESIKPPTVADMNHKLKAYRRRRMSKTKKSVNARRGQKGKNVKIARKQQKGGRKIKQQKGGRKVKQQKGGRKVKQKKKVKTKKSLTRKDIFSQNILYQ